MAMIFSQPPTGFGLACAGAVLAGLLIGLAVLLRKGKEYGDWIRLCVCCIPMIWLAARFGYALSGWVMIPLEGFFEGMDLVWNDPDTVKVLIEPNGDSTGM